MKVTNKNVLVVGTGLSGIAASKLLNTVDANITIYDGNKEVNKEQIIKAIGGKKEIPFLLGEFPLQRIKEFDLMVLSPGVPTDLPFIEAFRESGIPIWGEIELAYQFEKGNVIAITGTNGKTTTTALVGQIMKAYKKTFVVGNIGTPYTEAVLETEEDSVTVAEVSSFQLETIETFTPKVSAILNISPDHLNRHHTMENYIAAKVNVTKNQTKKETCVLNYEDDALRNLVEQIPASVVYFSSKNTLETGVYLKETKIICAVDGKEELICDINDLKILGMHNYENVMAAVAMTVAMGVPLDVIRREVTQFVAVPHRIEYVDTIKGVKYYNDSKGTNTDAAIKGIKAMTTPTLLIGGGYDKNSEYDEWIEAFDGKVKQLVLIGATKEKIADCARRHGFENISYAKDLKEAVTICAKFATEGDSVLLSPACASWGMFKNFEERGDLFKQYVREMK